jgi:hypothetical protein
MIMSVSTLTIGKGAATPVIFVNFSMGLTSAEPSRALQERGTKEKGSQGGGHHDAGGGKPEGEAFRALTAERGALP